MSEQPAYGRSPALDALPLIKAHNELPQAERIEASARFVERLMQRRAELGDDY